MAGDAAVGAENQNVGRSMREQAIADDAGNLVDAGLQQRRVGNFEIVHVEYVVAVVGDEPLSPDRLCAKLDELAGTYACAIGMTSIGSGNVPSMPTSLLSSTMQTKRCAAPASTFSRVRAPPPPLISCNRLFDSSAPSM